MAKTTAEQKTKSQNRKIIQEIGFEDFSAVCQEYQIIGKATRELLELAEKEDTPIRVKVDIYKWVVEMNIGKPKQQEISEQKDDEDKIRGFQVQYVKTVSETEQEIEQLEKLKQELKEMGATDRDIENKLNEFEIKEKVIPDEDFPADCI